MGARRSGSERSWSPFGRLASSLISIKITSGSRDIRVLLRQFVPIIGLDLHYWPHHECISFVRTQDFFQQPLAVDVKALQTVLVLLDADVLGFIPTDISQS